MIDIEFYMKFHSLKYRLMNGGKEERNYLFNYMEKCRSKIPIVYNIETTNACNMRCVMCPRTTMMTRSIETMDMETYKKVIEQLTPFSKEMWKWWTEFAFKNYRILPDNMSENHFFLYIIPKVITLHGYGDPLLDKDISERVMLLSKRGIESYFSCNPANINLERTRQAFENGLGYIKYSIEATSDERHKEVRGKASDFTKSYNQILQVLEMKAQHNYKTVIVITMLNLDNLWQQEEWEKLREAFKGLDVYIYLKSQDTMWYEKKPINTKSIHWLEFCQFPWSSMTIKSNGEATECVEDYNNDIILGNVKNESLYNIWNGAKYRNLRVAHFDRTPFIKCSERCDMKLVGEFVK